MRVPYTPYLEGDVPSGPYAPQLNVNINANMFGAPQARAEKAVGESVSRLGNSIAGAFSQSSGIENDTATHDLDVQGMTKLGERQTQFYSLEGKNAIDAAPQYIKDLQSLRQNILDQAPNDTVRKKVDQLFSTNIGNAIVSGGRHVAQQEKAYTNDTANASINLNMMKAAGADDASFAQLQKDTADAVRLKANSAGWPAQQLELELDTTRSKNWAMRLGYLGQTSPKAALDLYNQNKNDISPSFRPTIENQLWGSMNTKGAADAATIPPPPAGNAPKLSAAPGRTPDTEHVDPRLITIMNQAATHLPVGYQVQINEGYNPAGHAEFSQHHVAGSGALDIQIVDPAGKVIPNRGADTTGMYKTLAVAARQEQQTRFPELEGKLAWGGAFDTSKGSGVPDLMHFDLGGERGHITEHLPSVMANFGMPGSSLQAPGTGVFPGAMAPRSVRNTVSAELATAGVNPIARDGILANIYAESSFNPTASGDGKTSFGLFQHRADRRDALISYAKSVGGNATDPRVQVQFALREARNIDLPDGRNLLDAMNHASSRTEAAQLWQQYFEKPKILDPRRGTLAESIGRGEEPRLSNVPVSQKTEIPTTEAQVIAQARSRARAYLPADTEPSRAQAFEESTVRHAVTQFNLDKKAAIDEQSQAKQTIYEHMQDPKIEDVDTLLKDPEAYGAWQKTPPEFQYRIQQHYIKQAEMDAKAEERESKAQAKEAAAEEKVTQQQASSATRETLMGLALMEPRKFLNTDLAGLGLTKGDFNTLVTKRNEVSKGIQSDVPMELIRARLESYGLFEKTNINPKDFKENTKLHQFMGALHQLILEEKAATGKTPDSDRQLELAGTLIRLRPGLLYNITGGALGSQSKVLDTDRVTQIMTPAHQSDLLEFQRRFKQQYPDRDLPPIEQQLRFLDSVRRR